MKSDSPVLSIIFVFFCFLASWTFTVKVPVTFTWSGFSSHIRKCSQQEEKNKKGEEEHFFGRAERARVRGAFITKANVINQVSIVETASLQGPGYEHTLLEVICLQTAENINLGFKMVWTINESFSVPWNFHCSLVFPLQRNVWL